MTLTPQIIGWGIVCALWILKLIVMLLSDEDDGPPMGWLVPVLTVWSLIMLVRAICLAPYAV